VVEFRAVAPVGRPVKKVDERPLAVDGGLVEPHAAVGADIRVVLDDEVPVPAPRGEIGAAFVVRPVIDVERAPGAGSDMLLGDERQ
jgi:hypothetical protein